MQVVECSIYLLSFEFDQKALDILQISKENQENGFAMLSAVLWLGNISFSVIDNENHVEVVADEGIYILVMYQIFFSIQILCLEGFVTLHLELALLLICLLANTFL